MFIKKYIHEKEKAPSTIKEIDENEHDIRQSFNSEKTGQELEAYIRDISETVRITLDQSISILTPWFFSNMPNIYYKTTPRAEKVRHLSAIITGNIFEAKQTVELWNADRTKVTFLGPGGSPGIVKDIASKLKNLKPSLGFMYFSHDKLLFIATFFCRKFLLYDKKNIHIQEKIQLTKQIIARKYAATTRSLDHFFEHLDHDFIKYASSKRLFFTYKMLHYMMEHEGAHTFVNKNNHTDAQSLILGLKGLSLSEILEHVVHIINRYDFEIVRFYANEFIEGFEENINVMYFVIHPNYKQKKDDIVLLQKKLVKALRTLAWIDSDHYSQFTKHPYELSVNGASLLRSMGTWIHILLGKDNIHYYSEHKILKTFLNNKDLTLGIVSLFRLRFDPSEKSPYSKQTYTNEKANILKKIVIIIDQVERKILKECVKFIDNLLKTNYFLPTKTGLAFRLDPNVLDPRFYSQKPFGIFFITGRDYRFFHIRWKKVSRGGLRVVIPKNQSEYDYSVSGLFDEVYGLSHAQQLKNKDIPEGGSKGVMVVKPGGNKNRVVRGAINALLDLLVSQDESHEEEVSQQISYFQEEEHIYLGPDENITNDLITWAITQAKRRGYKYARAFMSSKPQDGINHKEYGVTSEGLHVYVHSMLSYLKINPDKDSFTVKMTGGPDGDVAGNEIKILHRSYDNRCKILAIADGSGAAYDPNGLKWEELLSLVKQQKPIACFAKDKLSSHSDSFVIDTSTTENIKRRNELHFTIGTDIFIPAGGRPYTVSKRNVEKFIDHNDKPSCRGIVEGANIFFTDEAREILQEKGVHIIKDSSANKTGVICSSYEIVSSLILTKKEFLKIKTTYIEEVVEILKEKAQLESHMLFKELDNHNNQNNLVELSKEISKVINEVTDTLAYELTTNIEKVLQDPMCKSLILRYCPNILQKEYKQKILKNLPKAYQLALLASYCASYVVYKEGLKWIYLFKKTDWHRAIMIYMKNDELSKSIVKTIEQSKLQDKVKIASILKKSYAKELTTADLSSS